MFNMVRTKYLAFFWITYLFTRTKDLLHWLAWWQKSISLLLPHTLYLIKQFCNGSFIIGLALISLRCTFHVEVAFNLFSPFLIPYFPLNPFYVWHGMNKIPRFILNYIFVHSHQRYFWIAWWQKLILLFATQTLSIQEFFCNGSFVFYLVLTSV